MSCVDFPFLNNDPPLHFPFIQLFRPFCIFSAIRSLISYIGFFLSRLLHFCIFFFHPFITSSAGFRILCLVFVHLSLIQPTPLSPGLTSSLPTAFRKSFLVTLSCSFPVLNLSVLFIFLFVLNLRLHFMISGLWSLAISVQRYFLLVFLLYFTRIQLVIRVFQCGIFVKNRKFFFKYTKI